MSFNLFGLYFTFIMGGLIILISYASEPALALIHKRRNYKHYGYLEWACNSVLQLQRQGHEGLGLGTWEDCVGDVPISQPNQMLGTLDITDPNHPLLRAATPNSSTAVGSPPDSPAKWSDITSQGVIPRPKTR